MMGNRGVLHDDEGRIRRPWQVRRWILCLLEFRGRHRAVMTPNRYTELFFLDEATGLGAGHRPCFECRRARFLAFREAWSSGNYGTVPPLTVRARAIDDRLHGERVSPGARNGPSRRDWTNSRTACSSRREGPEEKLTSCWDMSFSHGSLAATGGGSHAPGASRSAS